MTTHVDKLLGKYVDGQLDAVQARHVYQHLTVCPRCQTRMARLDQIARRLRDSLSKEQVAKESDIRAWWANIQSGQPIPLKRREYQVVASLALTSVLVILPILSAWSFGVPGTQPNTAFGIQSTELTQETYFESNAFKMSLFPNASSSTAGLALKATAAPVVPISAAPAPYTPSGN